jgi:lipoprotein-anchoring transpeptidase ErfK/SrfK
VSSHRSARPRYGRIALVAASCTVTVVAVLGGVGLLPLEREQAVAAVRADPALAADTATLSASTTTPAAPTSPATPTESAPSVPAAAEAAAPAADPLAVPAGAGTGRRVVFSEHAQRVWLVDADEEVRRTYLVSGSVTDNLHPGTYAVWSRSRWAVGIDDSGVMEYFVRFAHGQRAAIGFHSIPSRLGEPLQSRAQLGTPQSHGCVRQARPDAVAMWRFASAGTAVIVV